MSPPVEPKRTETVMKRTAAIIIVMIPTTAIWIGLKKDASER